MVGVGVDFSGWSDETGRREDEEEGRRGLGAHLTAMAWPQAREEIAIGFPNIENRGDEDWDVGGKGGYGDGVAMPSDVGMEGSGAQQNCVPPFFEWGMRDSGVCGKGVLVVVIVWHRHPDLHPAIPLNISRLPACSVSPLLPVCGRCIRWRLGSISMGSVLSAWWYRLLSFETQYDAASFEGLCGGGGQQDGRYLGL
ncbi:hypothetical protein EDD85DRAFT_791958 [Armillaria nabsnona]|nr:hypothetical protein EDD85DRAFT_791958 [Armillaria nabsnona]